jgi:hypothetical protein
MIDVSGPGRFGPFIREKREISVFVHFNGFFKEVFGGQGYGYTFFLGYGSDNDIEIVIKDDIYSWIFSWHK